MRVVMTDRELRISNYRREIIVPLRDVDQVTGEATGGSTATR